MPCAAVVLGQPPLGSHEPSQLESVQRRLHPPDLPKLRQEVAVVRDDLEAAVPALRATDAPSELVRVREALVTASMLTLEACTSFSAETTPADWIRSILGSMRSFTRALEALYVLRRIPPVGRYFAEPAAHARLEELDPEPVVASVGLHASGSAADAGERGGFCLYVPERYRPDRPWPLVVALHGGAGSGRQYLWVWLREARTRGFLLLAPTAAGPTWSMLGPDVDATALESMLNYVSARWAVDRERILLSGLSDGGTYALSLALRERSPFSAVAAIACTLHPRLMTEAGLRSAAGRRIYLVHGALDWMFPVEQARFAHAELAAAGADIVYREIPDLSHTYPREENDRILSWFDPGLRLPSREAHG